MQRQGSFDSFAGNDSRSEDEGDVKQAVGAKHHPKMVSKIVNNMKSILEPLAAEKKAEIK